VVTASANCGLPTITRARESTTSAAGGQLDVVGHAQQHALLGAHADADQTGRDAAYLCGELGIGVGTPGVAESDPLAVAGVDTTLGEVGSGVEQFRHGSGSGPNGWARTLLAAHAPSTIRRRFPLALLSTSMRALL
jgi:hypothetical protein